MERFLREQAHLLDAGDHFGGYTSAYGARVSATARRARTTISPRQRAAVARATTRSSPRSRQAWSACPRRRAARAIFPTSRSSRPTAFGVTSTSTASRTTPRAAGRATTPTPTMLSIWPPAARRSRPRDGRHPGAGQPEDGSRAGQPQCDPTTSSAATEFGARGSAACNSNGGTTAAPVLPAPSASSTT